MVPDGRGALRATGAEVDELVEDGAGAGAGVGVAVVLVIDGVVASVAGLVVVVVVTDCGGTASDGATGGGADGTAVLGVVEGGLLVVVGVVVGSDDAVVSGDWVVVGCACGVMVIAGAGATFTTAVMEV